MNEDEFAMSCLVAMRRGLEKNAALLAVGLPRVSSESLVVGSCVQGLLDKPPSAMRVLVENKKRDLVVEWGDPRSELHFEFKMLWVGGEKECLDGLCADVNKLGTGGFLVAAAFHLDKCPTGIERYERPEPAELASLISRSDDRLAKNRAMPFPSSGLRMEKLTLDAYEAHGELGLVAWRVARSAK
jgi:hypothetical protein